LITSDSADSGISFFGASPAIVAEISEIERIGSALRSAAGLIDASRKDLSDIWIQDPTQLLLLATFTRKLDRVSQLAAALASDCDNAAVSYLSAESKALGMFVRYSDALPLAGQLRGLLTASLGSAAVAGLGTSIGGLSLRAMASTVLPNGGEGDLPVVAKRISAAIAGSGAADVPESAAASQVSEFISACPHSAAELAARLSTLGQAEDPQLRIDAVTTDNGRYLYVYLPGTQSWSFGTENPLDMQSNLLAMSGPGLAASEAAAVAALGLVKFSPADKLVLVGHSQGGLIAKNLASTYPQQTRGLVTFGAPIVASGLPSVPALVFEHSNDPVPALAGLETKYPVHALTIARQFPDAEGLESHHMVSYVDTARLAATEQSAQFAAIQQQLGLDNQQQVLSCRTRIFQIQRAGDG